MTEWMDFEGRIQPMQWGDSVYTVLPLPDDVAATLKAMGAKRVEVELNDHPFNLALTKAPVLNQTFVYTGKRILAETGIVPGEEIEVRMRKVDPNHVETPDDVAHALLAGGVLGEWNELTPGKRRSMLQPVVQAKRSETRAARLQKLIASLR